METNDVVVIGAGIVGCCTALACARRGAKVVMIDRHQVGSGTTWHSGGLVRGYDPDGADVCMLMKTSWQVYTELGHQYRGRFPVWGGNNGGLTVARSEKAAEGLRRTEAVIRGAGVVCELLSPEQIEQRWPDVSTAGVRIGLFCRDEGRVNPLPLCRAAAAAAESFGCRLMKGRVEKIREDGNEVVCTISGGDEIRARRAVVATGLWGGQLTGLPVVAIHEQYIVPQHRFAKDIPVLKDVDAFLWGGVFNGGGRVLLGTVTTAEKAVELSRIDEPFARLPFKWSEGDNTKDKHPTTRPGSSQTPPPLDSLLVSPKSDTQSVIEGLCWWLLPALRHNRKIFSAVAGPEGNTPDLQPFLGPLHPGGRIWAAFGFSGHGMQLAGGVGELVADCFTGKSTEASIPEAFKCGRFNNRYDGDPCGLVRDVEQAHASAHPSSRKRPQAAL
eukprot:Hpha_TRINITY_DN34235_c0_g1::TRINITY_DN34235_c0_g1_i1::g.34323::m.34323/K00315/DMGDH; dimethylglycine dehydrogenase